MSTPMVLTLSTCVLFISLMQSVNGAQFLTTTSLPTLSGCAGTNTRAIDVVRLTSTYASL